MNAVDFITSRIHLNDIGFTYLSYLVRPLGTEERSQPLVWDATNTCALVNILLYHVALDVSII